MGLATLAASRTQPMDLVEDQFPERVTGRLVTSDYFQVLGFSPALGRGFLPEDEKAGAAPGVALSHRLWTERFQKDPRILGRPIELDGKAYAVVGVMPEGLEDLPRLPQAFASNTAFWMPISVGTDRLSGGNIRAYYVTARLAAASSLAQATASWDLAVRQLEQDDPRRYEGVSVSAVGLSEAVAAPSRPALLVLLGAVVALLLSSCANVAHLLLARAARRRTEMSVREWVGQSP